MAMLHDFGAQAEEIISSTIKTPKGRVAAGAHCVVNRNAEVYKAELRGLSHYLGVDRDVIIAGQLVYDASTVRGIDAVCGCTSAAQLYQGRPWHGRLLDWNWPESIRDRVRLIRVVTRRGNYVAEHIPGTTGFVGAYNDQLAVNLNQAPHSGLRWSSTPALWWFRDAFEKGQFSVPGHAPKGGMTDALIHVTHLDKRTTSRFYYIDGVPYARRDRLGDVPVVLTNTYDMEDVSEDADCYEWSRWREEVIVNSRKRAPERRLAEAECADTVHRWSVTL